MEKTDIEPSYWWNLVKELKATWDETEGTCLQIWNLGVQIVTLGTQMVPLVRTVVKKYMDVLKIRPKE